MNKRIQEIAEEATKYFPKTETSGEYWTFDKEKFAELIVRECSSIITSQDVDPAFKNRIAWAIKDRFGVE